MEQMTEALKSFWQFSDRLKKLEETMQYVKPLADFVKKTKEITQKLVDQNIKILDLARIQGDLIRTIDTTKDNYANIQDKIIPQVRENITQVEVAIKKSNDAIIEVAKQAQETFDITELLNIELIPNLDTSMKNIKKTIEGFIPSLTTLGESLPQKFLLLKNSAIDANKHFSTAVTSFRLLYESLLPTIQQLNHCTTSINSLGASITNLNWGTNVWAIIRIIGGIGSLPPVSVTGGGIIPVIKTIMGKLKIGFHDITNAFNMTKTFTGTHSDYLVDTFDDLQTTFKNIKTELDKIL